MKRTLITLTALISFMASSSLAQTVTTTAAVNLNVNGEVLMTKLRDLRMGAVVQGTTNVNINPLNSGSSAYFTISTSPNSPETITFSSTNLTNGSSNITFAGSVAGGGEPIQPHAVLIRSGDAITTSSTGGFFLWAGGSATLAPDQPTGDYTGSFTVSVVY